MTAFTGTPVNAPNYNPGGYQLKNHEDVQAAVECAWSGLYTHAAGVGTGEVNLVKLPPGRIRVLTDLSRKVTSQFATGADLHIGYRAYVEPDGDAVVADDNAFDDNVDVAGGAIDAAFTLPAAGYKEFDSVDGVVIFAMIDAGNIEDNDTISVFVFYQRLR